MPTAYTFMAPFARLVSFVGQWEDETKKELTELRNEQLMWGDFNVRDVLKGTNLSIVTARTGYVENRINELAQMLVHLGDLQARIDDHKCTCCDGTGTTGYFVPGDGCRDSENHTQTCEKCGGTGMRARARQCADQT